MKTRLLAFLLIAGILFPGCKENCEVVKNNLRAPAYPLITIDPYTSGWSFTDNLYDEPVKHWTGKDFPLIGAIRVDGEIYRFMGTEEMEMEPLVPTSEQRKWSAAYTEQKPAANWMTRDFNDSGWKKAEGAFGTTQNEPTAKTQWDSEHIWIRRTVSLDRDLKGKNVYLEYSNDDGAVFYINGVKVFDTGKNCNKNAMVKLPAELVDDLIAGENLIAVYCNNYVANGLIDFGLLTEKEKQSSLKQTAIQESVDVQATQTHYAFTCGNVGLNLTFTAPLLMSDLDLISRPVNYISYEVFSKDGKAHDIELYFEASNRWALDQPYQQSESESFEQGELIFLKTGSTGQNILAKWGDNVRIDWGYFYLASEKENTKACIGNSDKLRAAFAAGKYPEDTRGENENSKLALIRNAGTTTKAAGKIMLGYDDIYSIQYFGNNLRPYWNRNNDQTILSQFEKALANYEQLLKKCCRFDRKLMETAARAGGEKYAELCALAYRQAVTAHKLVQSPDGDLLFLSKENFSNGSIGTVDVTYPSAPLFLYYNLDLAKGLLNHIFYYSESGKWVQPFPAHDVGTYPVANGQTYGGDMPVEESGNMLILTGAITKLEGNAAYARKHWNVLSVWADYLVRKGLDPENQLCTDDFAGHFAHNTNLSVKAILGVASYGYMADVLGHDEIASQYISKAREMAQTWVKMADDGDHFRLTFDKPGTWSQKYNLVWDKLLGYNIFPAGVAEKEIQYYLSRQNKYGLPLDNRASYTKTDWIMWTATLADDLQTFEKFIDPLYLFMNETQDRIPMSDWVFTDQPYHRGFRARSVVGGYYIKMLEDKLKK